MPVCLTCLFLVCLLGTACWLSDLRRLIGLLRDRFVAAGGAIYERTSFRSAEYAKDGISIRCGLVSMVWRALSMTLERLHRHGRDHTTALVA